MKTLSTFMKSLWLMAILLTCCLLLLRGMEFTSIEWALCGVPLLLPFVASASLVALLSLIDLSIVLACFVRRRDNRIAVDRFRSPSKIKRRRWPQ